MKRLMFAAACAVFATTSVVQAEGRTIEFCGLDSKYDVSFDAGRLLFEKTGVDPAKVEMRRGRLFVDGREIALSEADSARIAKYEATVRALVPQAKAIARDAIEIAFTAVSEVAAAFSGEANASATRARMGDVRMGLISRVDDAFDKRPWHDDEFEEVVESSMKELLPVIIGEVVGKAVALALAGDEKGAAEVEKRVEQLEKDIERRIDTQTQQLAARAAALCPMVAELGAIELAMEMKLDNGKRLRLIEIEAN